MRRRLFERFSLALWRALPGFPGRFSGSPAAAEQQEESGVVVGFSGGNDSTLLLRLFVELAERRGAKPSAVLTAAHLDHGLTSDSTARARFARRAATGLGVPFVHARADVALRARREGRSVEEAGRLERLDFFGRVAAARGLRAVAVGHTQSDQAETLLFRLARGSGSLGLGAMAPARRDERGFRLIRPLLGISRSEAEELVRAEGWPIREDPSNESPEFVRNRIRSAVLPLLRRAVNPAAEAALARAAELLREDEAALARLAAERFAAAARISSGPAGPEVRLPASALAGGEAAWERRLVRLGLARVRGRLAGLGFRQVEAVRQLAAAGRGGARLDLPEASARLERGIVVLQAVSPVPVARPADARRRDGQAPRREPSAASRGYPGDLRRRL